MKYGSRDSRKKKSLTHCNTITYCNSLQRTATHTAHACCKSSRPMLHNTATQNTPQHTVTHTARHMLRLIAFHAAQHCKTLQHAATRRNTLQHAATRHNAHCNTPAANHRFPCCTTMQHAATRCNTLQCKLQQTCCESSRSMRSDENISPQSIYEGTCVTRLIHMCDMTHPHV